MNNQNILELLNAAANAIKKSASPDSYDFKAFFIANGCSEKLAISLEDYFICACGRGFAREIGMELSNTYQRRLSNGSWSRELRFDADPIWLVVEEFVETIRTTKETRKKFSLIAQHSAEMDAINQAVNAGETLEGLRGAKYSGVFNSPLD